MEEDEEEVLTVIFQMPCPSMMKDFRDSSGMRAAVDV